MSRVFGEKAKMVVARSGLKRIQLASQIIGISLFCGWGVLYYLWNGSLPTNPNESTGEVYSISFHGTEGFVTLREYIFFWLLPAFGLIVPILVHELSRFTSKR
jgi:hypothetical protein